MKVLVLSNIYPDGKSYHGEFIKRQVESLEKKKVIVIKSTKTKKGSYFLFYLQSIYYILFKKYDIIHAHYGFHSALPALIFKRKNLIITYHGSDALLEPYRNFLYNFLHRLTIKRTDFIIAVSKGIKQALIRKFNVNKLKISVISCGVNTDLFYPISVQRSRIEIPVQGLPNKKELRKELNLPESKNIILFVGEVSYNKGVDIIYECAKALKDNLFILIGNIKYQINSLTNFVLIGPKPNSELYKWFNACDLFFLPSRSEGMPVSVLEAMSCGLPVLASSIGGIPDIIKDGKTGWLIDNLDEKDKIINKLNTIINNTSMLETVGKDGRENIIKDFNEDKVAEEIKTIYNRVFLS
ncbi:MAG: glycosyltransferase family 4 protein [Candidatus Ratteibacteria bacterium]|nr:glycosyltransferase family 4 protein [Candidatus Ratteibacteria bacterium]